LDRLSVLKSTIGQFRLFHGAIRRMHCFFSALHRLLWWGLVCVCVKQASWWRRNRDRSSAYRCRNELDIGRRSVQSGLKPKSTGEK